ncbi:MAG: hypothetical protein ACTSQP_22415 [Promethearchaeota archaeon]
MNVCENKIIKRKLVKCPKCGHIFLTICYFSKKITCNRCKFTTTIKSKFKILWEEE